MGTASYEQFATGYYLTRKAMEWFWDAYTTDPAQRAEITALPNQASIEQSRNRRSCTRWRQPMDRVGVVGLGTMGGRIAARLLDAGYQVHATNRTPAKAQPLVKRGLHWHDTLRAVAAAAVVLGMVTDDTAPADRTGSSPASPRARSIST